METLQRKSRKSRHSKGTASQYGLLSGSLQAISVDAGLGIICEQISGVSCTRPASCFLGNFKGFSGASVGHPMQIRNHLQAFSATRMAICRQLCTFQTICSDSTCLGAVKTTRDEMRGVV